MRPLERVHIFGASGCRSSTLGWALRHADRPQPSEHRGAADRERPLEPQQSGRALLVPSRPFRSDSRHGLLIPRSLSQGVVSPNRPEVSLPSYQPCPITGAPVSAKLFTWVQKSGNLPAAMVVA
jgi:hypothetical protein